MLLAVSSMAALSLTTARARALLLVVWLGLPASAPAQSDDAVSEACSTAFEAAQVARRDGKLLSAATQAGLCARAACPAVLQRECGRIAAQLDDRTPRVSFLVRDTEGKERSDARVYVDGVLTAQEVGARSIPLDPGERTVRAVLPEGVAEEKVVLREGDRARVVELSLPRASPRFRMPVASWVLGSVGLAGVTAGAITGGLALAEYRDADETCGQSGGCPEEVRSSVRDKAIASDVTLGVGAAAVVSAVVVALATGWEGEATTGLVALFSDQGCVGIEIRW